MSNSSLLTIIPAAGLTLAGAILSLSLLSGPASATIKSCDNLSNSKLAKCCEHVINSLSGHKMLVVASSCGGASVSCRFVQTQGLSITHVGAGGGGRYICYSRKLRILKESSDHEHSPPNTRSHGNDGGQNNPTGGQL